MQTGLGGKEILLNQAEFVDMGTLCTFWGSW